MGSFCIWLHWVQSIIQDFIGTPLKSPNAWAERSPLVFLFPQCNDLLINALCRNRDTSKRAHQFSDLWQMRCFVPKEPYSLCIYEQMLCFPVKTRFWTCINIPACHGDFALLHLEWLVVERNDYYFKHLLSPFPQGSHSMASWMWQRQWIMRRRICMGRQALTWGSLWGPFRWSSQEGFPLISQTTRCLLVSQQDAAESTTGSKLERPNAPPRVEKVGGLECVDSWHIYSTLGDPGLPKAKYGVREELSNCVVFVSNQGKSKHSQCLLVKSYKAWCTHQLKAKTGCIHRRRTCHLQEQWREAIFFFLM